MEPSNARINAGCRPFVRTWRERLGNCTSGSPIGTSPITGVSVSQRTLSSVPAINAASVAGRNFLS